MTPLVLPRLIARAPEIPRVLFTDPTAPIPEELLKRVTPGTVAPWETLAAKVDRLKSRTDHDVALLLRDGIVLSRRMAADPSVWHYGTVIQARVYVFERWKGSKEAIEEDRLLGSVRRNALARLWWLVEALESDGVRAPDLVKTLFASNERLKLWVIDTNSFHGRPWLARSVIQRLSVRGLIRTDEKIDAFFKSLGRLSNVLVFDHFEDSANRLVDAIENGIE